MTQYDASDLDRRKSFLNQLGGGLGAGLAGLGGGQIRMQPPQGGWPQNPSTQLPPFGGRPGQWPYQPRPQHPYQQPPIQQQLDPWGIKGMGEQITGFEEQLGGYGETLGGYGEQIGGFGEQLGGYGEQLGGLGERMGGFESTLGGLGEKMGGFGEQFGNISDRLGKIEEGIAGLNKQSPMQQARPPGHTSSYRFNPYSMLGGLGGLFGYPRGFGRY